MACTIGSPRTLFVHVGPPKTGTSAVQHYLRNQETCGLLYPKSGRWADGAHHNLVFNYFEDFRRPEVVREKAEKIFQAMAAEILESEGNVLISSEALVAYDVGRFIDAVAHFLGRYFSRIEILLTYREHFSLASSLYNQRIKDAFYLERRDPNELLRTQATVIGYIPLIRRLENTGLKLNLVNYHPAATFVPRFLQSAGLRSDEGIKDERRNVSLSVRGMIAVLAANRVAESRDDRNTSFEALRKMRGFFAPSKFIFDNNTTAAVAPFFEEDRAALQETFNLPLPGPAFDDAIDCFFLERQDMEQIEEVVVPLGDKGASLVALAQAFLKC